MRQSGTFAHTRNVYAVLLFIVVPILITSPGCDSGQSGITGNDTDPPVISRTPPPNPLGNRTNPLQTHIRTHWTNGDPSVTGGAHRGHIKTYGHSYTFFETVTDPDGQASFVADNYDIYMGGGDIVGDHMTSESTLFLFEPTTVHTIAARDSIAIVDWLEDPSSNIGGSTFDDVVMHFKWDVSTWYADTPGWNPDDDTDGDRCRDSSPSEPDRTAPCIQDAEVRQPNFWFPNKILRRAKIMHPAYVGATINRAVARWGDHGVAGFHFDAVSYENWSLALDKTFAYEGFDEADPNHPMRTDLLLFVPTVIDAVEKETGSRSIHFGNTVSPYYTCAIPRSKELSLKYIENTLNENWLVTNTSGEKPMSTDRRADYLDCPFTDWMEQDRGYIFTAYNYPSTDRGKRFSLAMFYLINHQMAFYYYRNDGHSIGSGEYVWDKQWNEYVNFDVGQPAVNSLALQDFEGNAGTNRYFVMDTQTGYEILGREYERQDGTRILILVKLMDKGLIESGDPAVYQLPGTYRRVLPDLTLDTPVTQIQMVNNDGYILVEQP